MDDKRDTTVNDYMDDTKTKKSEVFSAKSKK